MSLLEIILRLAVVGLLTAYLVSRHRRRVAEAPFPAEDTSVWNGHAMDARTLRPHLAQVRRDYRAVPHGLPRRSEALRRQSVCARRRIAGLSYFQQRHVQEDTRHELA